MSVNEIVNAWETSAKTDRDFLSLIGCENIERFEILIAEFKDDSPHITNDMMFSTWLKKRGQRSARNATSVVLNFIKEKKAYEFNSDELPKSRKIAVEMKQQSLDNEYVKKLEAELDRLKKVIIYYASKEVPR